jgi:hypothetical protein
VKDSFFEQNSILLFLAKLKVIINHRNKESQVDDKLGIHVVHGVKPHKALTESEEIPLCKHPVDLLNLRRFITQIIRQILDKLKYKWNKKEEVYAFKLCHRIK